MYWPCQEAVIVIPKKTHSKTSQKHFTLPLSSLDPTSGGVKPTASFLTKAKCHFLTGVGPKGPEQATHDSVNVSRVCVNHCCVLCRSTREFCDFQLRTELNNNLTKLPIT